MKFWGEIDIILSYNQKYIVTMDTRLCGFYDNIFKYCTNFFTYFNVIQTKSDIA